MTHHDLTDPNENLAFTHGRLAGELDVVPTGIPKIDGSLWYWGGRTGIPTGEYVIVGGASSAGKTQCGMHLLRQASKAGKLSGIVSLEMKPEDLQLKIAQAIAPKIPLRAWEPGSFTDEHRDELRRALSATDYRAPILLPQGRPKTLSACMDALAGLLEHGVRFIVLDHIQLVKVPGVHNVIDRAEEVSETVREWAFDNDVTLVALSQLKRAAAENYFRSPVIQDLLGGTSLESNASQVFLLDHSRYDKDPGYAAGARTWIGHGKNRMGPSRYWVPVYIDHAKVTFTEAIDAEESLWPQHAAPTKGRR